MPSVSCLVICMVAVVSEGSLSDVLRDFKSYTAKKIIEMITQNERESRKEWLLYLFQYFTKLKKNKSNHQFWQHNNHPIDILSGKWLEEKIAYIHENPVKARIVDEPDHYMYSSAYPGTTLRLEAWK